MNYKMQRVIALVGPSGSGKTTQERKFLAQGFTKPVNYTTRQPRPTDTGYTYISVEEFIQLRDAGLLPIHTEINDTYYAFEETNAENAIYVVDGKGLQQLRQFCEEKKSELFSVFLDLSEEECVSRMIERGDSQDSISKRTVSDTTIRTAKSLCDIVIDARKGIEEVFADINDSVYGTGKEKHTSVPFSKEYDTLFQKATENSQREITLKFLDENIDFQNVKKVLEVGMGNHPRFANQITHKNPGLSEYHICEIQEYNGKLPDKTIFHQMGFESFNCDNTFDLILFSHVLYYFKDKENVINQIKGYLSDQGKAIIVITKPYGDGYNLKKYVASLGNIDYKSTYEKSESILVNNSYKIEDKPYYVSFSNPVELYEILKMYFEDMRYIYENNRETIIEYISNNFQNGKISFYQTEFLLSKG